MMPLLNDSASKKVPCRAMIQKHYGLLVVQQFRARILGELEDIEIDLDILIEVFGLDNVAQDREFQ